MRCKYQKSIERWGDGEIKGAEKRVFENHLSRCTACRQALQTCREFQQKLRNVWRSLEPSANFEILFWEKADARKKKMGVLGTWLQHLDSFLPAFNFSQTFAALLIAFMIGGVGGTILNFDRLTISSRGMSRPSTLSLSGFGEFKGLPSTSIAAAYLKSINEKEFNA